MPKASHWLSGALPRLSQSASSCWLGRAGPGCGAMTLPPFRRAYLPLARGELGVWHTAAPKVWGPAVEHVGSKSLPVRQR